MIARRSVLPRSTKPIRRRNAKRCASELLRCYGPPARRRWMKGLPCMVCVAVLPELREANVAWRSDQAHVEGDGASHKAGYDRTVPLCRTHHRMFDLRRGILAEPEMRETIIAAADEYEAAWRHLIGAAA